MNYLTFSVILPNPASLMFSFVCVEKRLFWMKKTFSIFEVIQIGNENMDTFCLHLPGKNNDFSYIFYFFVINLTQSDLAILCRLQFFNKFFDGHIKV